MDQRVQLKHPRGKKPISMSREKYNLLKPMLLKYLRAKGKASFSTMTNGLAKELKTNKLKFEGSLPWHLEWVKLDLEARKVIKRVPATNPQEYMIVR